MDDKAPYRIGFDIGGTFTDASLTDGSGHIWTAKVLTTQQPELGALESVKAVLEEAGIAPNDPTALIHGTTLVSNALIERKGAAVGLLTTEGFTDVLEMGRELRYDVSDLSASFPEPLVPRTRRRGVRERTLVDGTDYLPVDLGLLTSVLEEWRTDGVEAVAVCLLHSYRDPGNEQAVAEAVASTLGPDVPISVSSEVAAEFREYERTSTTVVNAYAQPLTIRYQRALEEGLRDLGSKGRLYVMLSSGGIASTEVTSKFPVRLLESGPAAGVLAAAHYGAALQELNLVSFDVGGTTAKACLVRGGQPTRANGFEVARASRFMKGSGIPVRAPSIDMLEIGAGGGSIASVDDLGLLKVGPRSAGSAPGPACYGLGGTRPTVTDANLLLGYLDAASFAGGSMPLDEKAATCALEGLAGQLGMAVPDTAWGVFEVASEQMAAAVRVHLAEKGYDPRRCSIFAFGGGGPIHASHVARKLGIRKVICPLQAGVMSAIGLLVAPPAFDFVRTHITQLDSADWAQLESLYSDMEERGRSTLRSAGVPETDMILIRSADMRYLGQMHELTVTLPALSLTEAEAPQQMRMAFADAYASVYGAGPTDDPIEILNWRLLAKGPDPDIRFEGPSLQTPVEPERGTRQAYFPETGFAATTVYDRYSLPVGFAASGPAVVEERESTAVIGPADEFEVDQFGNLVVHVGGGAA